ncbi:MAG: stage III sporulation protein AF [Clostridiales bacterium]|jgi:stage III sporulation protein AF|nr:stage III sporulation protein AF [Clostridiales bacterium]
MSYISHWLRNLSFFLIFSAFAGIILPNEKYKKYIDLCFGIVLVIIMLQPITGLLGLGEFPVDELFDQIAGSAAPSSASGDEYTDLQWKLVKESFDSQVKAQISAMIEEKGYSISSLEVISSEDLATITSVKATVRKKEAASRPFIYIEPVKPSSGANASQAEPAEIKKLKTEISDFYKLSVDNIFISEMAS